MKRREFLKEAASKAARAAILGSTFSPAFLRLAHGAVPLDGLRRSIGSDGLVLAPTDGQYAQYRAAFNKRTLASPLVIVACGNASAVASSIQWARANGVPIRMRCGGHSYEGFSQGTGIVIDVRQMSAISVDPDAGTASVGAGAALGRVYAALYAHKLTIPAGSCPTVGISGHLTGGGFGLLGRKYGLACDSLRAVELVDAQGNVLTASADENPDLFWACRGGGGGSFGVITRLDLGLHSIDNVAVAGMSWAADASLAQKLIDAWQRWAPQAPDELTALLTLTKSAPGRFAVHVSGQYVGSSAELQPLLRAMTSVAAPVSSRVQDLPFDQAVAHFSGGSAYPYVYMKGKSDYAFEPIGSQGIAALLHALDQLGPGGVGVIFDSYGGAVNRVDRDATAFFHREGTLYSMQYFSQWANPSDTPGRLAGIRAVYAAMRPYVSGHAYVNYCDTDLPDWQHAYWGSHFERLAAIKAQYDPENLFSHAQSIPPAAQ